MGVDIRLISLSDFYWYTERLIDVNGEEKEIVEWFKCTAVMMATWLEM